MSPQSHTPPDGAGIIPSAVLRKVYWRIVPLVFVLYIVSYLDRANAGFAKLQMQELPGFSDDVFGLGFSIFFVGYLLLEIPGALLVEHWSARKWFARILLTWGLCSMGMALVRTPGQFYVARFVLGLAEAGFFPGIIVYFAHWFPQAERARGLAGLILAVPFSQALGAWVSGEVIKLDWLGLAGWQWVFLVEGLPACLLGVAVLFLLTDRPRHANWLTAAERDWLERKLELERSATAVEGVSLGHALRLPTVWLLAMGVLVTNIGGIGLGFWLPTTIQNVLSELHVEATPSDVLAWSGVFYACGMLGVWLAGQSSDRSGERKWHCVTGQVATGVFLAASAAPGLPWDWVFFLLCLAGFFSYTWGPAFWVMASQTLTASAAAVAIGFINICANIAGILGPYAVGKMKMAGFGDRPCLLVLAGCYVAGGVIIALLRLSRSPTQQSAAGASNR